MKRTILIAAIVLLTAACYAVAGHIVIEPDDHADDTDLSTIIPEVTLRVAGQSNNPVPFKVRSKIDGQGRAPTGDQVFAQEGVYFFNNNARLRMEFTTPVTEVSLAFSNGTGRLDAFDAADTLLDSYTTAALPTGVAETMTIVRPQGDIAYAVGYVPAGGGAFGRLDHLEFTPVPEPATWVLACMGLTGVVMWRRRNSRRRTGDG